MIASFDGVELYLNKEARPDDACVCVIVHGLCEHQGRYDYLAEMFHANGSAPTASTTGATAGARGSGPTMTISTNCWTM